MSWFIVAVLLVPNAREYSVHTIGPVSHAQCRKATAGHVAKCLSLEGILRLVSQCHLSGPVMNAGAPYPSSAKESEWHCEAGVPA